MGFFSWKTMDTHRSIPNRHSNRKTFSVTMTDNLGHRWTENNYDGYGVFGGKDFYVLLAEMNGLKTRDDGIELMFSDENYISPNLTENENWEWIDKNPELCDSKGYFY